MESSKESNLKPLEATVLDQDGKVLFDPSGGSARSESTFESGQAGPRIHVKTIRIQKPGFFTKLAIGLGVGTLLFVGIAAAGILLGIFLVGLLAKMTFSPNRRRRN